MSRTGKSLLTISICALMAAVTLSIYWPVVHHEFISFDDSDYITQNATVLSGLNWAGLKWAFQGAHAGNWHPVTWLSHMLDTQIFGQNAGLHHLTNALFHAVNSALLFLFFLRVTGMIWRSALMAMLFALHPLHVESVAWVAERKDVLSTFFFLLTLLAYARFVEFKTQNPKPKVRLWCWYALAMALFALGLMSKPMLVTLPFVLLLLDFWPLQRFQLSNVLSQPRAFIRLVLEKMPFFVLAAACCGVTIWAQAQGRAIGSMSAYPLNYRIANAFASYLAYIEKMFWPVHLSIFYPSAPVLPLAGAVMALLLIGLVSFIALKWARSKPYLLVGWFWYLGTLVPVIGLVQVGGQAFADRYAYIPLIGPFIMLVWFGADLLGTVKYRITACSCLAAVSLLVCAHLTIKQISYWHDDKSLFTHALDLDDRNNVAMIALGNILASQADYEHATNYFHRAIQLHQNDATAWHSLGRILNSLGNSAEAEKSFQNALHFNPSDAQTYSDYAGMLINLGRLDEAQLLLSQAEVVNPSFLETRITHVALLQKQGRLNDAIKESEAILQVNPGLDTVRIRLASFYSVMGRPDLAAANYREVARTQPNNSNVRIGLGLALVQMQDFESAETEFSTVLKSDPKNARALDGLGFALAEKGSLQEANVKFAESIQIDPTFPDSHMHYAMCLSAQNEIRQAISEYHKTIALDDQRTTALNNLAWTLASHPDPAIRNGKEAVELAEKACRLTSNQQPFFLGTLAAAYAESGRFSEAVTTAEKARDLASQMGSKGLAARNEQLLELYRAGKPYHETH